MNIKTKNNLLSAADNWADLETKKNVLRAEQTERINATKRRYNDKLEPVTKSLKSLKGKITRFLDKNAKAIFGQSGTGTVKTNQVEISLHNNPPAIELVDKTTTDEAQVAHAKACGFHEAVVTREAVNKEVLGTLSDEDLETLGYVRKRGRTLTLRLLADPSKKTKTSA